MSIISKTKEKRSLLGELATDIFVALAGSFVIAASGPVSIPLPFTVVPMTVQVHVALLVAFLLGKKRGAMAVMMFLMQGAMGYPVFAGTAGAVGMARILGPTGGYLIGYFIAALVMGSLKADSLLKTFAVLVIGNVTLYFFGFIWLSTFIGIQKAFLLGILPFVLTDVLKTFVCTMFVSSARKAPLFQ